MRIEEKLVSGVQTQERRGYISFQNVQLRNGWFQSFICISYSKSKFSTDVMPLGMHVCHFTWTESPETLTIRTIHPNQYYSHPTTHDVGVLVNPEKKKKKRNTWIDIEHKMIRHWAQNDRHPTTQTSTTRIQQYQYSLKRLLDRHWAQNDRVK